MGLSFQLNVVSERGEYFSGSVDHVTVPGVDGSLGIYFGHAPLLAQLKPGVLEIARPDGEMERMLLEGGIVEVQRTGTTVLANTCRRAGDLDRDRALRACENARECIHSCSDEERVRQAYARLEVALAQLRVLEVKEQHRR